MDIINLPISECEIGDIIAKPIINDNGLALVTENTTINKFIKDKLIQIGNPKVWIHRAKNKNKISIQSLSYKKFGDSYDASVILVKKLLNSLVSNEDVNYEQIIELVDLIYGIAWEDNSIIRYLQNIRNADEYTYTHSINTALYGMLIAKWMGLLEKEIKKVIQAGLLHDVGKIKIDGEILNKKGKLTDEEFEEIKKHTIFGYDLVDKLEYLDIDVKRAVLMHHERVDGSGYPFNCYGKYINIYSKILAIADVYDAMTSDRIYKKKVTPFDAFEMFMTIGVGIFDPAVLTTFVKKLSPYYIGSKVVLSNGETGEIAYIPPQNVTSPIIIVGEDIIDFSRPNKTKIISFFS